METRKSFSCIDCGQFHCSPFVRKENSRYPQECLTAALDESAIACITEDYAEEENHRVMMAAAETEYGGYGKLTRIEETMEVARRIGAKKIGIATCAGLIHEAKTLAKIFRVHGFEVVGVICKVGAVKAEQLGIPQEEYEKVGGIVCNPILQAKTLNKAGTDLNVVVGLCVGHDSLFYKYSEALVTTLVVKDRVLAHNPVAALYTSSTYYRKLLRTPEEESIQKEANSLF